MNSIILVFCKSYFVKSVIYKINRIKVLKKLGFLRSPCLSSVCSKTHLTSQELLPCWVEASSLSGYRARGRTTGDRKCMQPDGIPARGFQSTSTSPRIHGWRQTLWQLIKMKLAGLKVFLWSQAQEPLFYWHQDPEWPWETKHEYLPGTIQVVICKVSNIE